MLGKNYSWQRNQTERAEVTVEGKGNGELEALYQHHAGIVGEAEPLVVATGEQLPRALAVGRADPRQLGDPAGPQHLAEAVSGGPAGPVAQERHDLVENIIGRDEPTSLRLEGRHHRTVAGVCTIDEGLPGAGVDEGPAHSVGLP
jgi:hypothetical protein